MVVGSTRDTARVSQAVGLPTGSASQASGVVVVVTGTDDLDAVRDALAAGTPSIVAIVAIRLDEDLVLAAYDMGLAVAFGYCTSLELDAAIACAPDREARQIAAVLASVQHLVRSDPS
jgi:hypothetical protein